MVDEAPGLITVALAVENSALADHLAALLANVAGIRLVGADEPADARLIAPPVNLPGDRDQSLTPREVEVLTLLAEGASNKIIARRLNISIHTAKFHVGQLLDKLDATGRTDAVAHAVRLGVLQL